jgi:hypothetical protein
VVFALRIFHTKLAIIAPEFARFGFGLRLYFDGHGDCHIRQYADE